MADLKTPWTTPPVSAPGLSGAGVVSSGTDPNASGNPGPAGLQTVWPNAPLASLGLEESANSVSNLPSLPNRFEPAETPPEPPSLQDRSPGTIDKQ